MTCCCATGSPTVSPPTRGWTSPPPAPARRSAGFPAHAGMDPPPAPRHAVSARFPRPRRDGPLSESAALALRTVSPPTRGWTLGMAKAVYRDIGFPAHAGMDPARASVLRDSPGFPRPRGDGPAADILGLRALWVSPPTRGWTLVGHQLGRTLLGFPAHAGMDPARGCTCRAGPWFPRPRGDGPWTRVHLQFPDRVSPPTRGWTRGAGAGLERPEGFPAHAGIDPTCPSRRSRYCRFPRPRGDGPAACSGPVGGLQPADQIEEGSTPCLQIVCCSALEDVTRFALQRTVS